MEPARWITILALTIFLAEGFTLSVFPVQFKELLQGLDPRALQAIGLIETVVAVGLIAGIALS